MAERLLRLVDTVVVSRPADPGEPILLTRGSEMVRIRRAGPRVRDMLALLQRGVAEDAVLCRAGQEARGLVAELSRLGWLTGERPYTPAGETWDRQVAWWYAVTPDGQAAQRRLAAATVAVLGVGGVGALVARHLAAGGVRDLWLLDHDTVAAHNLNRQYLYERSDIGQLKVTAAAAALVRATGSLRAHPVQVDVGAPGDLDVLNGRTDLLIVAADRPRHLMDLVWEWAAARRVPVLGGGVGLSTGYWGPLLDPAHGGCWPCFEGARLARLTDEERRLEREGVPTPHSFGPTNAIVADYLARDAMLFLGIGRCASLGRRQVVDVLGLTARRDSAEPVSAAPCDHGGVS